MSHRQETALKQILVSEGRKQVWLCEQTGISETHMSAIVNRGFIPPQHLREAIATALGRTAEDVFPSEVAA